jgi:DUF1009 family protein
MPPKLGIIAGQGALPARIIEHCRRTGRQFFVLALEGQTDPAILGGTPHVWARLGAAGRAIEKLREARAQEVVLAGAVTRPSLAALRPDRRAAKLLGRLARSGLGDDGLLSALVRELEGEGFQVIGADDLLDDMVATTGPYGAHAPDEEARADIELGVAVARALGELDVGQAVVVQQGVVLGVEAIEGTDALIARCGALQREGPGGVLVKVKKPPQERRVDLPTVGVQTVAAAAAAGLRGIAVEAGGALIVDPEAVARKADETGLFVIGVAVPG